MISVWINEQPYQVAHCWEDITIGQAAELMALKMPDSLRHAYDVQFTVGLSEDELERQIAEAEKQITLADQHKHIPRYFGSVLLTLSDIPAEIIKQIDTVSIRTMYHSYLKKFVEGVLFLPADYTHVERSSFTFQGVIYMLPTDRKVFGKSVPMVDVTALEFTESADLMIELSRIQQERDFSRAANLISILCRPQGEVYDENVSLERAEQFRELPMNICWDVFFSLITPLVIYGQFAQIYLLQKMEKESQEAMKRDSSDGTGKSCSSPMDQRV